MKLEILERRLLDGDRQAIAKAMTLVESTHPQDREKADRLLLSLVKHPGDSLRVGISGIPGVGKSTEFFVSDTAFCCHIL